MSNYFTIFPTTIARYRFEESDKLKETITDIIMTGAEARHRLYSTHYYEYTSSFLDDARLDSFKEFVNASANAYAGELLGIDSDMMLTNAWINQTNTGHLEDAHNHANAYVSGTYYVNFDSEIHSVLEFYKNSSGMSLSPYIECATKHINLFNANKFIFLDLQEGDLLLWPSHVEHGYSTANTGDNRISISMNFLPTVISNGPYKFKVSKV